MLIAIWTIIAFESHVLMKFGKFAVVNVQILSWISDERREVTRCEISKCEVNNIELRDISLKIVKEVKDRNLDRSIALYHPYENL